MRWVGTRRGERRYKHHRLVERLPGDQAVDLCLIQTVVLAESFRHALHRRPMFFKDGVRFSPKAPVRQVLTGLVPCCSAGYRPMPAARRFPPPWTIEEANNALSCATTPGRRSGTSISRMSPVGERRQATPPRRGPPHRRQHRYSRKPASRPKPGGAFCGDSLRLNSEKH
jgi:hypothetical protein